MAEWSVEAWRVEALEEARRLRDEARAEMPDVPRPPAGSDCLVVPYRCFACGARFRVVNDSAADNPVISRIVLGCTRRKCGRQVVIHVERSWLRHNAREKTGQPFKGARAS